MNNDARINELMHILEGASAYCFDTETTGLDPLLCELVGCSFSIEAGTAYYVPFSPQRTETLDILKLFTPLFHDTRKTLIGQNVKYDIQVLRNYGIEVKNRLVDTMLAHYL